MTTADTKPGGDVDIVARRKEIIRRRPKIACWIARAALAGYLFALWRYQGWLGQHLPATADVAWSFESSAAFLAALKEFAIAAGVETLRFFLIGFLVMWAVGKPRSERSTFLRKICLLAVGLGLTTVVVGWDAGGMPERDRLWIPVIGCLIGMTVGSASLRGKKGLMNLAAWSVAHLLLLTTFLVAVLYFATDSQPLDVERVEVPAAEKRRLVDLIKRAAHDRSVDDTGEIREIRLSEDEVKTLCAWGLETLAVEPRLDLRLEPETVTIQASPSYTLPLVGERFLNTHVSAQLDVADGQPHLQIDELQVGRLGCPKSVCDSVSRGLLALLRMNDDVSKIVDSIQRLQVDEAAATLSGNRQVIRDQVLPVVQSRLGISPELIAATGEHLQHIVSAAGDLPRGDERFVAITTEAFRFAQQRSADRDPVIENQAAILSLGIVLGHRRVADLAGTRDAVQQWSAARQRLGNVTIRSRGDWTQHFCVSAALVVLADTVTSDWVGLLKEEIDSAGGSGFSFGDLLADRAGTLFAEAATRDEASARKMQERFAGGITIDDIFPPADDLPEGIQEDELKSAYGGIGGPQFREMTQEIERRLRSCYLLQP
mgnify:CR=1 FL=1